MKLSTSLLLQVGTSSFAASHISHQDANQHYVRLQTPDLGTPAWRSAQTAERQPSAKSDTLQQASKHTGGVLKSPQKRQAKPSWQIAPQQNKNSQKLQDDVKGADIAGQQGKSISPQESCAHVEATAPQPVPTADRKTSLNRLSRAFQAKRPRDSGSMLERRPPIPNCSDPDMEAKPCSIPAKQVAWSKSIAKGGFDASKVQPATKKAGSGIAYD